MTARGCSRAMSAAICGELLGRAQLGVGEAGAERERVAARGARAASRASSRRRRTACAARACRAASRRARGSGGPRRRAAAAGDVAAHERAAPDGGGDVAELGEPPVHAHGGEVVDARCPRRARASRAASRRARARRCRRACATWSTSCCVIDVSPSRSRSNTSKLYDIDIVVLDRTVVIHVRQRRPVCHTHWKASIDRFASAGRRPRDVAERRGEPRRRHPAGARRRRCRCCTTSPSSTPPRRCAAARSSPSSTATLWAARGLDDDRAIADPFRPSAEAAGLLALRVEQLRAADARGPARRRLRRRLAGRAGA